MGRKRSYMLAFEGLVTNLQRRYRETDSSSMRERIEEYMSLAVPRAQRRTPQAGGAMVTVGGSNIHEFTKMSVTRALAFLDELDLTETEQLIGARIVKEIRERLTFLDNVGVGYPARPRLRDASRRGPAPPPRDADRGAAACRRSLHPRRAVDRAPSAR